MISILLDQGLAPRAAALLRVRGIDASHVSAVGLAAADDSEILDAARRSGQVRVTLDRDFHAHARRDSPQLLAAGHNISQPAS